MPKSRKYDIVDKRVAAYITFISLSNLDMVAFLMVTGHLNKTVTYMVYKLGYQLEGNDLNLSLRV